METIWSLVVVVENVGDCGCILRFVDSKTRRDGTDYNLLQFIALQKLIFFIENIFDQLVDFGEEGDFDFKLGAYFFDSRLNVPEEPLREKRLISNLALFQKLVSQIRLPELFDQNKLFQFVDVLSYRIRDVQF